MGASLVLGLGWKANNFLHTAVYGSVLRRCVFLLRSYLQKLPKFAGLIYSNVLVQFRGDATVNKEMYIDTIRPLRDAVRKKRPEKWRTNNWFFFHYNAPEHRSLLVKNFLTKNNVT
jgi:hypothetical protein